MTMDFMFVEIARLMLGLLIAAFHRPIADYILAQERQLVIVLRQRGIPMPATPTTETTRTLYFLIGISVALIEITRIWMLMHAA